MSLGRGLESLIPQRGQEKKDNEHLPEELNQVPQEEADLNSIAPAYIPTTPPPPQPTIGETEQTPTYDTPVINEPQQIQQAPQAVEESVQQSNTIAEDVNEKIIFQIEVDKIEPNPHQPRRSFDEDALRDLAQSIREFGVMQPIIVTKKEEESEMGLAVHYELIAGERRLLASRLAGQKTIPAIVRKVLVDREKLELAIIENIQREELNAIEFARSVSRLQDEFKLTQLEIATRLGKSRGVIANSIRLLTLPTEMQDAIASGKMSEGQARILLSLEDASAQQRIFQDILSENLSVREVDKRAKHFKDSGEIESKEDRAENTAESDAIKADLEEYLGTKVDLQNKGGGGKITINYYSPEELETILGKMFKQDDPQSL